MGFLLPTAVAGLGWGDWRGGFFYAAAARLLFVHHSTFCVNSLAHWLGDTPFDSKHTPRDHVFTALVTIGEGYHNCACGLDRRADLAVHHEFPQDFRNAIKWYQVRSRDWRSDLTGAVRPDQVVHLDGQQARPRVGAQDLPGQRGPQGPVHPGPAQARGDAQRDRVAEGLEPPADPELGSLRALTRPSLTPAGSVPGAAQAVWTQPRRVGRLHP